MKVIIKRPNQFADRLRDYRILIDDVEVACIGNALSMEITVPDSTQRLNAKIDWCYSNALAVSELQDGEVLTLKNRFAHQLWNVLALLYYLSFGRRS